MLSAKPGEPGSETLYSTCFQVFGSDGFETEVENYKNFEICKEKLNIFSAIENLYQFDHEDFENHSSDYLGTVLKAL